MRDRPAGVTDADVRTALAAGWGIDAHEVTYRPVGAGSYHWTADDRWFITVDRRGFADSFDPLRRALATAAALRRDAGLHFVLAPIEGPHLLWPLGGTYALSVFPLIDGTAGDFGPHGETREPTLDLIAALHRTPAPGARRAPPPTPGPHDARPETSSPPAREPGPHDIRPATPSLPAPEPGPHDTRPATPSSPTSEPGPHDTRPPTPPQPAIALGPAHRRSAGAAVAAAQTTDLALPGRAGLVAALGSGRRPSASGPYAGAAQDLLAGHAGKIRAGLDAYDRMAAELRATAAGWVITHGEPHPGNVMRTDAGLMLIDWDTVRIAPPERDLWLLTKEPFAPAAADLSRYARATGREPSQRALDFYRLAWILADVAAYADDLRRPHGTGGDAEAALTYLRANLTMPW